MVFFQKQVVMDDVSYQYEGYKQILYVKKLQ